MSSHALIHFLLGLPFQLLLQTTIAHGAIIPQSPDIASTAPANNMAHCVDLESWVGDGIIKSDCAEAIREFYRTNVEPRGGQEYEFYAVGAAKTSRFPTVLTPGKYDYGTCVVVVAMLDIFSPGLLPGDGPNVYQRADIATFDDIYDVAVSLSSKCVDRKREAVAGWSSTGAVNSVGVFILRRGADLDKILRRSALAITSVSNGTSIYNETSSRIELPRALIAMDTLSD